MPVLSFLKYQYTQIMCSDQQHSGHESSPINLASAVISINLYPSTAFSQPLFSGTCIVVGIFSCSLSMVHDRFSSSNTPFLTSASSIFPGLQHYIHFFSSYHLGWLQIVLPDLVRKFTHVFLYTFVNQNT